jgi:phosphoglycolate phosphatase-like HAD superfamily hydrolase
MAGAPTHVLLDVDGTLIDSRPAIVAAYRHAFAEVLGIEHPQTEAEVRALLSPRLQEACELVAGDRADACVAAYRAFYLEHGDDLVTAIPGAAGLLDGLVARGVRVGLVTNKGRERIGPDLRRAGLDGVPLAALVCAEDTLARKPDPEPILLAMHQCGCRPEAAMYVGDGPQDVLAARAAGTRAVGAAYGYYGRERLAAAGPEALISRPEELLDLIDGRVAA